MGRSWIADFMEDESAQPHAGMSQLQSCGGQATIGMTFGQKMKIHPAPLLIEKYADEQREFPMNVGIASGGREVAFGDGGRQRRRARW